MHEFHRPRPCHSLKHPTPEPILQDSNSTHFYGSWAYWWVLWISSSTIPNWLSWDALCWQLRCFLDFQEFLGGSEGATSLLGHSWDVAHTESAGLVYLPIKISWILLFNELPFKTHFLTGQHPNLLKKFQLPKFINLIMRTVSLLSTDFYWDFNDETLIIYWY